MAVTVASMAALAATVASSSLPCAETLQPSKIERCQRQSLAAFFIFVCLRAIKTNQFRAGVTLIIVLEASRRQLKR